MQQSQFEEQHEERAAPTKVFALQESDTSTEQLQLPTVAALDAATVRAGLQKLRRQAKLRWNLNLAFAVALLAMFLFVTKMPFPPAVECS